MQRYGYAPMPKPTTKWLNVLSFALLGFVGDILPRVSCCSTPPGLPGWYLFLGPVVLPLVMGV